MITELLAAIAGAAAAYAVANRPNGRDELTGLLSYSAFKAELDSKIRAAKNYRLDELIAVYFIDLNGFKKYNDTYGHAEGDRVLISTAGRIRASVRADDAVCRRSGDEFIVAGVFSEYTQVREVYDRLSSILVIPARRLNDPVCVTASIGLAVFPGKVAQADRLLENADAAMYAVKKAHYQR